MESERDGERGKNHNQQQIKSGNTMDTTYLENIINRYYEQLYANTSL